MSKQYQTITKINLSNDSIQINKNDQIDTTGKINEKLTTKFNKSDIITTTDDITIPTDTNIYSSLKVNNLLDNKQINVNDIERIHYFYSELEDNNYYRSINTVNDSIFKVDTDNHTINRNTLYKYESNNKNLITSNESDLQSTNIDFSLLLCNNINYLSTINSIYSEAESTYLIYNGLTTTYNVELKKNYLYINKNNNNKYVFSKCNEITVDEFNGYNNSFPINFYVKLTDNDKTNDIYVIDNNEEEHTLLENNRYLYIKTENNKIYFNTISSISINYSFNNNNISLDDLENNKYYKCTLTTISNVFKNNMDNKFILNYIYKYIGNNNFIDIYYDFSLNYIIDKYYIASNDIDKSAFINVLDKSINEQQIIKNKIYKCVQSTDFSYVFKEIDPIDNQIINVISTNLIYIYKNNKWNTLNIGNDNIDDYDNISIKGEIFNLYDGLNKNIASGSYSHAEGYNTIAIGDSSHAEGYNTLAAGIYSHTEGRGTMTETIGKYAHAEGSYTKATYFNAHAEGGNTLASGENSHAEGYQSTASGKYTHAEGQITTASGISSHAQNGNTTAEGPYSHAEGYGTTASSYRSHAEGYQTVAGIKTEYSGATTYSGNNSHAEGNNTQALGNNSHAGGLGTYADQDNMTVIGKYNVRSGNNGKLFVVGNGTGSGDTAYRDAFVVSEGGEVGVQKKVIIGNGIDASNYLFVIGNGTETQKKNVLIVDDNGKIGVQNKIIIGNANDDQNYLFIIGNGTEQTPHNALVVNNSGDLGIQNTLTCSQINYNNPSYKHIKLYEIQGIISPDLYTYSINSFNNGLLYISIAPTGSYTISGTSYTFNNNRIYKANKQNTILTFDLIDIDDFTIIHDVSENQYYMYYYDTTTTSYKFNCLTVGNVNIQKRSEIFNLYSGNEANQATGTCSHAEGYNTKAYGNNGHAEGYETNVGRSDIDPTDPLKHYGYSAHAEGHQTSATSAYSHTEGFKTLIGRWITTTESGVQSTFISGMAAHAEGYRTCAGGDAAHAEGYCDYEPTLDPTTPFQYGAIGYHSHSEGRNTVSMGSGAHSEGNATNAYADYSHAEGQETKSEGIFSHVEGQNTKATGAAAHAEGQCDYPPSDTQHYGNWGATNTAAHTEGSNTLASGPCTHAEGRGTQATGYYAHSEGYQTYAIGKSSHAEGESSYDPGNGFGAIGDYSHSEGYNTKAVGISSHAEGSSNSSSGNYSHAEGESNTALGNNSHVEGKNNLAYGYQSHAEGYNTKAYGSCSHTGGIGTMTGVDNSGTITKQDYTTVIGTYNNYYSNTVFVVGFGSDDANRRDALFITANDGKTHCTVATTGADYAELYETYDTSITKENYKGHFITMINDKVKIASDKDDYILGVYSINSGIVGNDPLEWANKYKRNEFNEIIYNEVKRLKHEFEIIENKKKNNEELSNSEKELDKNTKEENKYEIIKVPVINENYDSSKNYINRTNREEWIPVGLLGKLLVIDNGKCKVNGFCKVAADGTAEEYIKSRDGDIPHWRVIKRLNENKVFIIFK